MCSSATAIGGLGAKNPTIHSEQLSEYEMRDQVYFGWIGRTPTGLPPGKKLFLSTATGRFLSRLSLPKKRRRQQFTPPWKL
ncbi:hypothetical protein EYF80_025127 [Liparis tanakae]|uniref:Uncharacterized protein n=1 Tax=Liparis tanakae TaxID=230148 RepID=A0A4Z2HFG9_9TELE|nr:hypothetical protein EYF80_025127 [Liparis tanakae]